MDVDEGDSSSSAPWNILITSTTGSLTLLTPVSESTYRRLSALQSQLVNTTEHVCGLNPRAFRGVESDGAVGRGVIDGCVVRRWAGGELGVGRAAEVAGRVGAEPGEVRGDLEGVGGGGLGFL